MSGLIGFVLLAAAMNEGAALPVEYHCGVDGPVAVVRAEASDAPNGEVGDLLITVANRATKTIGLVEFWLTPADCPGSRKPAGLAVAYGGAGRADAPIPVGGTATVTIGGGVLRRVVRYQLQAGCAIDARPVLTLARVGFCDGSGWEGYATGPD